MNDQPKAARPNDPDSVIFERPNPYYETWQENERICSMACLLGEV